ncbi:nucleolar protein 58-like [Mizuhopecten yessoensis]|uniref:nucleolar protein 58-like n=1 Tax=Mizuhopecten yessoensis TaxID=6573 RepID=UPI000B45B766|nr:nucleolar protein 58-like [Mizuhopecten yessoensis]
MQCTCISLLSLVSLKTAQYQASKLQHIDDILLAGDELFRIRMAELKSTNKFVFKMLQFKELPSSVFLSEKNYEVHYHDQIYGCVTHSNWNQSQDTLNLQEGIENLFSNYNQGLIIVGGICSAVYLDGNRNFSMFDSHSHGPDGFSCVDGRAMEVTFHNIEHLVNFMFSFYRSANISMNSHCQFEIQPVTINKLTDVRKSLLDKYFDYQAEKANLKIFEPSSANRKEYMKEYMQKRRQSSTFTKKQSCCSIKSKQKARQNKDYKQKDRGRTIKSMTKARQSKEFQKHELKVKQNKRELVETKEQERQRTFNCKKKARQRQEFKEHELKAKQKKRQELETKEKERQRTFNCKKKARQRQEFNEHELKAKQKKRQ